MIKMAGIGLVAFGFVGCASTGHLVRNTSSSGLYAVSVESDGKKHGHGYLAPGAIAGYYGSMKITKSSPPVISWKRDEFGDVLYVRVYLDRMPRHGEKVMFELNGYTVHVSFRK